MATVLAFWSDLMGCREVNRGMALQDFLVIWFRQWQRDYPRCPRCELKMNRREDIIGFWCDSCNATTTPDDYLPSPRDYDYSNPEKLAILWYAMPDFNPTCPKCKIPMSRYTHYPPKVGSFMRHNCSEGWVCTKCQKIVSIARIGADAFVSLEGVEPAESTWNFPSARSV